MDPIYSNCNANMNAYTARVFRNRTVLNHFNAVDTPSLKEKTPKAKAKVKVEVLKEEVISQEPAPIQEVVETVPAEKVDVTPTEDVAPVAKETSKKKTTSKKKKATKTEEK